MDFGAKLRRSAFKVLCLYSVLIGASSYRYDLARNTFKATWLTQLVVAPMNLFVVGLMPYFVYRVSQIESSHENAIIITVVKLQSIYNSIEVYYTLLRRFLRDRAISTILTRWRHLQRKHLSNVQPNHGQRQRLRRIYYAKVICDVGAILVLSYLYAVDPLPMNLKYAAWDHILSVAYSHTQSVPQMSMLIHFSCIWQLAYDYGKLNAYLDQRLKDYKASEISDKAFCRVLRRLRYLHWQLSLIMKRINKVFNLAWTLSRLGGILFIASTCFIIFAQFRLTLYQQVGLGILYCLWCFDLYLNDLICDLAAEYYQQTRDILSSYTMCECQNVQVYRMCDEFSWQIAALDLRIDSLGLFTAGKKTWLNNFSCSISWVLVMLQCFLINRLNENA